MMFLLPGRESLQYAFDYSTGIFTICNVTLDGAVAIVALNAQVLPIPPKGLGHMIQAFNGTITAPMQSSQPHF